jgi:hypothetical protein
MQHVSEIEHLVKLNRAELRGLTSKAYIQDDRFQLLTVKLDVTLSIWRLTFHAPESMSLTTPSQPIDFAYKMLIRINGLAAD